jgi:hypothetical protein
MGVGSIIVGIAAFLFMFGGFFTSIIPFLGTLLSFGAPLLAIAGIVLGGLGLSRAKRDGEPTGAPTAGLILNIVALIPALVIALTCGLCNACITAGAMNPQSQQNQWWLDGGGGNPFAPQPGFPLGPDGGATGAGGPLVPGQPPPVFPPPPMGDAKDAGAPGSAPGEGEEAPSPSDPGPAAGGRAAGSRGEAPPATP